MKKGGLIQGFQIGGETKGKLIKKGGKLYNTSDKVYIKDSGVANVLPTVEVSAEIPYMSEIDGKLYSFDKGNKREATPYEQQLYRKQHKSREAKFNDEVNKYIDYVISPAKGALQTFEVPANTVAESLNYAVNGKFNAKRLIPEAWGKTFDTKTNFTGRTTSDIVGFGKEDEEGIRHADIWWGKGLNAGMDIATDPLTYVGAGAMRELAVQGEKALLREIATKGLKVSEKKLNKLLTNELERTLQQGIKGQDAIKVAVGNVAKNELKVTNFKLDTNPSKSIGYSSAKKTIEHPGFKGAEELFASNKELQKIGSLDDYQNYLKWKFPGNANDELLYHGAQKKFDKFGSLEEFGGRNTGALSATKGVSLTDRKELADLYQYYNGAKTPGIITDRIAEEVKKIADKFNYLGKSYDPKFRNQLESIASANEKDDYIVGATQYVMDMLNEIKPYHTIDDIKNILNKDIKVSFGKAPKNIEVLQPLTLDERTRDVFKNVLHNKDEYAKWLKNEVKLNSDKLKNSVIISDDFEVFYEVKRNGDIIRKHTEQVYGDLPKDVEKSITKEQFLKEATPNIKKRYDRYQEILNMSDDELYKQTVNAKHTPEYSPHIKTVLADIKHPTVNVDKNDIGLADDTFTTRLTKGEKGDTDAYILKNVRDPLKNNLHVVKDPNKIHILGEELDIKGFSDFMKNPDGSEFKGSKTDNVITELTEELSKNAEKQISKSSKDIAYNPKNDTKLINKIDDIFKQHPKLNVNKKYASDKLFNTPLVNMDDIQIKKTFKSYLKKSGDKRNLAKMEFLDKLSNQEKNGLVKKYNDMNIAFKKGDLDNFIKLEKELKQAKGVRKTLGYYKTYTDDVYKDAIRIESILRNKTIKYPSEISLKMTRAKSKNPFGEIKLIKGKTNKHIINHEVNHAKHSDYNWAIFEDTYARRAFHDVYDILNSASNKKMSIKDAEIFSEEYDYLISGNELSSYLGTNYKDILVDEGLINDVNDNITEAILDKSFELKLDPVSRYKDFIKDKKAFVKLVNILPYSLAGAAVINTQIQGKQEGGEIEVDIKDLYKTDEELYQDNNQQYLDSLYNEYPAVKTFAEDNNVLLYPDTNFTRENTGVGSIEYFSPYKEGERNTVIYPNKFEYANPNKEGATIVYNPKTNDYRDVRGDYITHAMHQDKGYEDFYNKFKDAYMNSKYGQEEIRRYDEEIKGTDYDDGKEQYYQNQVDGIIRNLMFEGTPEDFKEHRYWDKAKEEYLSDPKIKETYNNLIKYLKAGKIKSKKDGGEYISNYNFKINSYGEGGTPEKTIAKKSNYTLFKPVIDFTEPEIIPSSKYCNRDIHGCADYSSNIRFTNMTENKVQPYTEDAWFMKEHNVNHGGDLLYEKNKGKLADKFKLFQIGDFVELTRNSGKYADRVSVINKNYKNSGSEHVAIIVGFNYDGVPIIEHSYKGSKEVRRELLDDSIGTYNQYKVAAIYRNPEISKNNEILKEGYRKELSSKKPEDLTPADINTIYKNYPQWYNHLLDTGVVYIEDKGDDVFIAPSDSIPTVEVSG